MTDILTLSHLDLRKEVAKAKGIRVEYVADAPSEWRFRIVPSENPDWAYYFTEDLAWEAAFPLDLAHTFPLVLEMNRWGWGVNILTYYDTITEQYLTVVAKHDDGREIAVPSDSYDDPSDAITKAYLLVRKEMGMA